MIVPVFGNLIVYGIVIVFEIGIVFGIGIKFVIVIVFGIRLNTQPNGRRLAGAASPECDSKYT